MIPAYLKNNRLAQVLRPTLDRLRARTYMQQAETALSPEILQIEPTAACNLKCIMCFRESNQLPSAPMKFELYKKIIDDSLSHGVRKLRLYFRGEPLLHPRIADMVGYATEQGHAQIELNTNGQLLNETRAKALADAGLNHLFISIEGHTAAQYEAIRRGGSFERLLDNIHSFNKIRRNLPTPIKSTLISVNMKGNEFPNDKFHAFWGEHFDDILVVGMVSHSKLDNPELSQVNKMRSAKPCMQLWSRLVVMSDGTVPLCCADITGNYVLGNLATQTISEVWHDERLKRMRTIHKAHKRNEIPLCSKCTFME